MKNIDQNEMYNELVRLSKTSAEKKFFYKDFEINDTFFYRIFTYQLPGFMDFQEPYAKETRGSMFLVNKDTLETELVALPMPKFFTFRENPETIVSADMVNRVFLKVDGSLISSYLDIYGNLKFKTKKVPEQKSFNDIINGILYDKLEAEIKALTQTHTLDFELVSPYNRVILDYKEPKLHLLKARNRTTGEFLDIHSDDFSICFPHLSKILVEIFKDDIDYIFNSNNRNLDIKKIEGLVLELKNGDMLKVKTNYYLSQNRFANIQDFSKYNKLLVEACIEESFDELRTLFSYKNRSENYDFDGIMRRMDSIEKQVQDTYYSFIFEINDFYQRNKHLEIEDFLSKIKEDQMLQHSSVLMPMFKSFDVDLKAHYMKMIGSKIKP